MMEARLSTETSVLTGATRRTIPEDGILHQHAVATKNVRCYTAVVLRDVFAST
jgi:hypothetical protein